MTLRVAFAGTSDFAVPVLRACLDVCDVAVVVTQPDKPGSRGKPAPRPVAEVAAENNLPVLQPRRIRDQEAIDAVLGYDIDALVLASFGQIIPVALLDAPRFGSFNVHPSLLPRWRGATPVVAAILAGDDETGVCIMKMEAGLDTGPVYKREGHAIAADETAVHLSQLLAEKGAALLKAVLADVEAGTAQAVPQSDEGITYAPRLTKADGVVDWSTHDAVTVDRMVRALNPWPGVSAQIEGRDVRILSGASAAPGFSLTGARPGGYEPAGKDEVRIQTANGVYRLFEVQPAGRRAMRAVDFLRGLR